MTKQEKTITKKKKKKAFMKQAQGKIFEITFSTKYGIEGNSGL